MKYLKNELDRTKFTLAVITHKTPPSLALNLSLAPDLSNDLSTSPSSSSLSNIRNQYISRLERVNTLQTSTLTHQFESSSPNRHYDIQLVHIDPTIKTVSPVADVTDPYTMANTNININETFKGSHQQVMTSSEENIFAKSNKTNSYSQNQTSANGTNNNRFIRRLFACGGYCARSSRRAATNVASSNSAYGLSKSTTTIQAQPNMKQSPNMNVSLSKNNLTHKSLDSNHAKHLHDTNNNNNNNNNNSQFHSELSLSRSLVETKQPPVVDSNINRKQSHESIIDKILSTPTKLRTNAVSSGNFKVNILKSVKNKSQQIEEGSGLQKSSMPKQPTRKNLLNENLKRIESDNHKLFHQTEIYTDKNEYSRKASTNSNLVLPVLKINDINVQNLSHSASPRNQSHQLKHRLDMTSTSRQTRDPNSADSASSNVNVQINTEESDEYDEEDEDEETGDEDETMAEDIVALQREVLKALRSQGHVGYDLYQELEEMEEPDENYNMYYGENEDEEYEDAENIKIKNLENTSKLKQTKDLNNNDVTVNNSNDISQHKEDSNEHSDSILRPQETRRKSDDLTDSNKYFNSLQHFQLKDNEGREATEGLTKSSKLNMLSQKTAGAQAYSEDLNSANNGANLFVLLVANRKKNLTGMNENKLSDSIEKFDEKTPVKSHSRSNYLSPANIVPSTSLNTDINSDSNLNNNSDSFTRQVSHDPIAQQPKLTNPTMAPISSASVSTTNTSDSNLHSLNLPQNLLESMSQVSSNYSIDKSSSTMPTLNGETVPVSATLNKKSLKKNSTNIDLEESEESDVLNEIFKVNQWLKDNHHKNGKVGMTQLLENIKSVDEHSLSLNQNSIESILSNTLSEVNNEDEDDDDDDQGVRNDTSGNKGSSGENNDSAIDISSYGSISNLSKISSKHSRVKWQSFTKHYRINLQHNATWSKYQISAISCEQLMGLRKLALLQFSKLLERQHSSMIRTLRLFSKKKDLAEFQRVYDSIDALSKSDSSKLKSSANPKDPNDPKNKGQNSSENVIIDTKKISHQLGAQIGYHPTNEVTSRKRRKNKLKKLEQQLINEKINSLPKSNSNIFQDGESYSQEARLANQLTSTTTNVVYKNVNDSLKNTIFNTSNKTSRVVFGVPLSTIIQQTGQALPQRILEAMKFIRKIAQHEVGIFRKNGVKTRITKLKELIDKNECIHFQSSDYTVFDIADMIKLYFRELPECLLTNKLSDILLTNYNRILPEERKIILQQVMLLIPDENRLVLQTLLLFLSEISKYNKINQMTRSNLAVCFSPVIFRFSLEKKTMKTKLDSSTTSYSKPPPSHTNSIDSPAQRKNSSSNINVSNFLTSMPLDISLPIQSSKSNTILSDTNATSNNLTENIRITEMGAGSSTVTTGSSPNRKSTDSEIDFKKQSSVDNSKHFDFSSVTLTEDMSGLIRKQATISSELGSSQSSNQGVTFGSQYNTPTSSGKDKQNYKRKYSEKINKAASSLVNFGAELSSSKPTAFFSDSFKENLENMSKVIQLCVSDMIKYSMDLFTVPQENFEKLAFSPRESPELDFFYNCQTKQLTNPEFFNTKFTIENITWTYQDKFEDVSIYFCKHEQPSPSTANLPGSSNVTQMQYGNSQLPMRQTSNSVNMLNVMAANPATVPLAAGCVSLTSVLVPKPECFYNKLKLWKCCTLVKTPNLTVEKILNRIKNERHMWDDDFKEGKVIEALDEKTDLYKSIISFMPPHPTREFVEIRHLSMQKSDNNLAILTSSSVRPGPNETSREGSLDVMANLLVSKYVIEKLIANDTTTTFKITHYVKLDYKGFTLEFYNKTFGYIMARLLYNLKVSLTNDNKS